MLRCLSIALLCLGACASDDKVKEIDNELEVKGRVGDSEVGLDDDGRAIVQTETYADDELRVQEFVNSQLEEELDNESFELQACRGELADPRLGGDGQVGEIAEIEQMKNREDVKEEFGLTQEGELKVVKREDFMKRLKSARRYEKTLRKMSRTVKLYRQRCEAQLAIARRDAGLPGRKYQAKGYFLPDGTWVETQKGERTLDDAYEISARGKSKANAKDSQTEKDNP